jgi:butyryl-CoA dehydrogenase
MKRAIPLGDHEHCAETGLFGVSIPEEYGGMGGGSFENCIVVEELSKACLGVSVSYAASQLGAYPYSSAGRRSRRKNTCPK